MSPRSQRLTEPIARFQEGADPTSDDDVRGLAVDGLRGGPGRYRLERLLGAGSQGIAALAHGTRPGDSEPVVVKLWKPSFLEGLPGPARLVLRKESVSLGRLAEGPTPSEHVVRLLDQGEVRLNDGRSVPCLVLEYLDGGAQGITLKQRVQATMAQTGKALSPTRARRILGDVAQGLKDIHHLDIIHRDLRPSNVLLTGEGEKERAKVADLGVSRPLGMMTTLGHMVVGSAGYAAPEQHDDSQVGPWSDVFSFGAVLYHALVGAPMFAGTWPVVLAAIHQGRWTPLWERDTLHPVWERSGVLFGLEGALRTLVAKRVEDRLPSMAEAWSKVAPLLARAEAVERAEAEGLRLAAVAEGPEADELLAASARGLWAWRNGRWQSVPVPKGLDPSQIAALAAVGRGRWLAGGSGDGVVVFTEDRCEIRQPLSEPGMRVTAVAAKGVRSFAAGGSAEGRPSVLFAYHDGRWAPPMRLTPGLSVVALGVAEGVGVGVYDVVCAVEGGGGTARRRVRLRWFSMEGRLAG